MSVAVLVAMTHPEISSLARTAVTALTTLALAGCFGSVTGGVGDDEPAGDLVVDLGGDLTLTVGESAQLTADVSGPAAVDPYVIRWSTSDSVVATVSPAGMVVGRADGVATVTATATVEGSGLTASGSVMVRVGSGVVQGPDSGLPADDGPETPPTDQGPPADPVVGQSITSGRWSEASTWHDGVIPGAGDRAIISSSHTVIVDVDTEIAGIEVQDGSLLRYDLDGDGALRSTENVEVRGVLEMRPQAIAHVHTLTFVGVDENGYEGSSMDMLDSDVGLWVMGAGRLSIRGTSKTPWTRLSAGATIGETSINLQAAPVGWEVGDEIVVVPTDKPGDDGGWDDATQKVIDPFHAKFERRLITAVSGATVSFDAPLAFDHAQVVASDGIKTWTAEVANLTHNVKIGGTVGGRAHIFIRSQGLQKIAYLEGHDLGPRKLQGDDRPQLVTGRYALHFHHSMEGSRGSWVHGTSFHDNGNRVFVPHMSHGITMRKNVSFHSMEAAFWWDFQEITHDTLWENNLMALVSMNGVDSAQQGMVLNMGDGNVARGNVAVYASGGDLHARGAYHWDADSEGVWVFEDNMAHSTGNGIFIWQNTGNNHTIVNYESYNNRSAALHGAYGNSYGYRYGYHYDSVFDVKATSGNSSGVTFQDITFDAGGAAYPVVLHDSPIPSGDTNKWIGCDFRNYTEAAVQVYSTQPDSNPEKQYKYGDLIECTFDGEPYKFDEVGPTYEGGPVEPIMDGNRMRVQNDGVAWQTVKENGQLVTTDIAPFAPAIWGTGEGLAGEYYNGTNFDELAFNRIDSVIMFDGWSPDPKYAPFGVHYLVPGDEYSMRWTGSLEPQTTGDHVFRVNHAGGVRLWIDDQLVIDAWDTENGYPTEFHESTPVAMAVGERHTIKLEHVNREGTRGCRLNWSVNGGPQLYIPTSQAYPD